MAALLELPFKVLGDIYTYAASMSPITLLLLLLATGGATLIFVSSRFPYSFQDIWTKIKLMDDVNSYTPSSTSPLQSPAPLSRAKKLI